MSWSTQSNGARDFVLDEIKAEIAATSSETAGKIAEATCALIEAAVPDVEREITLYSHGHADENGLSSYSLTVGYSPQ